MTSTKLQRGEATESSGGGRSFRGKKSARKKRKSAVPAASSAPSTSATQTGGKVTVVTLNSMVAGSVLFTFSAFGSSEKFLDGSSLPPGTLHIHAVSPFKEMITVAHLNTSFVTSCTIPLPIGRQCFRLVFQAGGFAHLSPNALYMLPGLLPVSRERSTGYGISFSLTLFASVAALRG
jgi:hypothetical protein